MARRCWPSKGCFSPWASRPCRSIRANGRVTAEPIWAKISSPHYHAAAMDGYAVRAEETHGATETSPKLLAVGTQAIVVDTGDPLPAGNNAVIMIEHTHLVEDEAGDAIEIMAATAPWRHVRAMGEDMVATELVLPANHRLRPQDLGAIAGCGHIGCDGLPQAARGHPAHRHRAGDAGQSRSSRATSSSTTRSCWRPRPRRPAAT